LLQNVAAVALKSATKTEKITIQATVLKGVKIIFA